MVWSCLNGLHRKTGGVIFACHWTLMLNPQVGHLVEAAIFYRALKEACACQGGGQGGCREHHED